MKIVIEFKKKSYKKDIIKSFGIDIIRIFFVLPIKIIIIYLELFIIYI